MSGAAEQRSSNGYGGVRAGEPLGAAAPQPTPETAANFEKVRHAVYRRESAVANPFGICRAQMNSITQVWASHSRMKSELTIPIRIMPENREEFDLNPAELEHWGNVTRKYKTGSLEKADVLPRIFVGRKLDTNITNISDFSIGGGFFIISKRCADVFVKFNINDSRIFPIEIFQGNRKCLATDSLYFILYIGCKKQSLVPECCNPITFAHKGRVEGGIDRYSEIDLGDGDCALSAGALDGPDLWIDPAVQNSFFMSNRLVEALQVAKFSRNMFLRRCRVVDIRPVQ